MDDTSANPGLPPRTGAPALTAAEEAGLISAIFSASPHGMALFGSDLLIRLANDALARQLELPLERIVGQPVAELFPQWADELGSICRRARTAGGPFLFEAEPFPGRDGSEGKGRRYETMIWPVYGPDRAAQGYLLQRRDVTQCVKAEEEREWLLATVERQAAELDATIASIADGFVIFAASGEVVRMNGIAHTILGYGHDEAPATAAGWAAALQVETPDGRPFPVGETPPVRALRGETVHCLITILRRRDGRAIWTSTSAAPICAPDGRVLGAVLTFADVTGLHALQQRITNLFEAERRGRDEAQAAVRARDEFLAAAAHELKTPVANLRGFAELTLRRLAKEPDLDPERLRQALEIIDQQSDRLAGLVAQLLDVSAIEIGEFSLQCEETDIADLVRRSVARAQASMRRHTIAVEVPPSAAASVDVRRLELVLHNLLDNAARFSPEGTSIEVSLSSASPDGLRLVVRDHGPGVAPERRDRLFSRFYQAQTGRAFAGLGLGLYYSRQVAERHGGHIEAEFPSDGGTRIVVTLPARGM